MSPAPSNDAPVPDPAPPGCPPRPAPAGRYDRRPCQQYVAGDAYPNECARDVTIKFIVDRTADWLVFVGKEDGSVWVGTAPDYQYPDGFREAYNRAIELQSYEMSPFPEDQKDSYRWLIGNGVAAALGGDPNCAKAALDGARDFIAAHNREIARRWLVRSSAAAALVALGVMLAALAARLAPDAGVMVVRLADPSGWNTFLECVAAACAGGLGGLLSIVARIGTVQLDSRAGWALYRLEGFTRIASGVLGALFVVLACKLHILNGVIKPLADPGLIALIFVGFLAGVSERLVPSLISRVQVDGPPPPAGGGQPVQPSQKPAQLQVQPPKPVAGKVVSAGAGRLKVLVDDGPETDFTVPAEAAVTQNKTPARLEEIARDTPVKVTTKAGDPTAAAKVEAGTT